MSPDVLDGVIDLTKKGLSFKEKAIVIKNTEFFVVVG